MLRYRAAAERAFATALPNLTILDIMLGEEMDGGFTLCRHLLARKTDLPAIFLTSRADVIDRISGLRHSPLAKALMKKTLGDEVTVEMLLGVRYQK